MCIFVQNVSFVIFLCYGLVCLCARTFNYRLIILDNEQKKSCCLVCFLSSRVRSLCFILILFFFDPPCEKSFYSLWIWFWNAHFCMRTVYYQKTTKTTTTTNGSWPKAVLFIFYFPFSVFSDLLVTFITDQAFSFRRKKWPKGIFQSIQLIFLLLNDCERQRK